MDNKLIKVLLIEDSTFATRHTKKMLDDAKSPLFETELKCADRLSKGLEYLVKGGIDIVLLDLTLPDSDELETYSSVHTQFPDIPIIVISGIEDETLAVQAVKQGAPDYLIKGRVSSDTLKRSILYALERKRADIQSQKLSTLFTKELEEKVKERTQRIEHLNLILRAIRNVNQLIVQEKDPQSLIQGVCDSLIKNREYENAWIAVLDKSGRYRMTAEGGLGKKFLPLATRLKKGKIPKCGQKALAKSGTVVIKDTMSVCSGCPLAGKDKCRSVMTIRLQHAHNNYGFLTVYTFRGSPIDKEEKALFEEVANDVAFALHSIEVEEKRRQMEEALQRSEGELKIRNRIADVFLTIPDAEMYSEVLKIVLDVMKSRYGVFGYIDENGSFVCPSLTRDIWDKCEVPDKTFIFPRDTWGKSIWVRSIKEKKTLYSNKPLSVPEGHISILRALMVPIIYQREVIGLFEVANKRTNYDKKDIQLLETIATKIAPILNARLERDALAEEQKKLNIDLAERVKELKCLYGIDKIATNEGIPFEEKLREIADIILLGLQHPEIACSRITLGNKIIKTSNFKETKWTQTADILVNNQKKGLLEVFYMEERLSGCEEPFLKEEKDLISSISEQLGQFITRMQSELEVRKLNEELEQRVEERTAELKHIVKMMTGREVRMAELKEVIKKLRFQLEASGIIPGADDPLKQES